MAQNTAKIIKDAELGENSFPIEMEQAFLFPRTNSSVLEVDRQERHVIENNFRVT